MVAGFYAPGTACPGYVAHTGRVSESWASSPAVRATMRGNRRRDTEPELAVRRRLHRMGLRYRVDYPPLSGHRRNRADVVFTKAKVAVFIDGCFWHGCPEHHRPANTNATFWSSKVEQNRARDQLVTARLQEAGWVAMRFWEHDDPQVVAKEIATVVRERLAAGAGAPEGSRVCWRGSSSH
ncbi:very short patch repair endonuclease [Gordonia sp. DT101]|uniref:very short patch repair endonuclease n=1 Tax=Gordonia sp. DT101 TaxID=3416545 RepID=UPI003CF29D5B